MINFYERDRGVLRRSLCYGKLGGEKKMVIEIWNCAKCVQARPGPGIAVVKVEFKR